MVPSPTYLCHIRRKQQNLTALCRYSLQEILRDRFIGPFQRLDEDDAVIWLRFLRIETLDADGHCQWERVTTIRVSTEYVVEIEFDEFDEE